LIVTANARIEPPARGEPPPEPTLMEQLDRKIAAVGAELQRLQAIRDKITEGRHAELTTKEMRTIIA
jgi:hypothetical protein